MVRLAQYRHHGRSTKAVLWVGDVRALPVADDHYDTVFTFGVLHHVVDWRAALKEVYRVLKPGGRFYAEEILKKIYHPSILGTADGCPSKDRFDRGIFEAAVSERYRRWV